MSSDQSALSGVNKFAGIGRKPRHSAQVHSASPLRTFLGLRVEYLLPVRYIYAHSLNHIGEENGRKGITVVAVGVSFSKNNPMQSRITVI